jgi:outer membrane protein assembly factor BamE
VGAEKALPLQWADHIRPGVFMPASHRIPLLVLAALSLGLAACSSVPRALAQPTQWLTPYRSDVLQGNFISSEQVAQLTPGLSRLQVRNLLGTPLVSSLFHADRWDYVFSIKRGTGEPRMYRYTVFFKGDALQRFEGDAMPSEAEFIAQLDVRRKLGAVPQLQASEEQLTAARGAAPAAASAAPPAPAASLPPATAYPPLEGPRP